MYIITQTSLFDNEEIEILGDLERLKLAIENMLDGEIIKKLRKIRKNGAKQKRKAKCIGSIRKKGKK